MNRRIGAILAGMLVLDVATGSIWWWLANTPSAVQSIASVAPVQEFPFPTLTGDMTTAGANARAALVQEWEHGYKTDRVIATRYKGEAPIGYHIGFEFPKDINNADRAEVGDFFRAHGGWIMQSGGYPGAVTFVKFTKVTDKETANQKLKEILPALDQLMADMAK